MKKDHINISDAPIVLSEKFNRLIRFVYTTKYVYVYSGIFLFLGSFIIK